MTDFFIVVAIIVYLASAIGSTTACGVPAYVDIEADKPTKILTVPKAHGICVQPTTGNFVVVTSKAKPSMYLYDNNAVLQKAVPGPKEAKLFSYCAYGSTSIYVTDPIGSQIFKYDDKGENPEIVVTGQAFYRIIIGGTALFISELNGNKVFDGIDGKAFDVGGEVVGMAFDRNGYLYCAMANSNQVKIFDPVQGKHMKTITHKEALNLNGLVMDECGNTVVTDSGKPNEIIANSPQGNLISRITGELYKGRADVGISQGSLIVSDLEADKVYFYSNDRSELFR